MSIDIPYLFRFVKITLKMQISAAIHIRSINTSCMYFLHNNSIFWTRIVTLRRLIHIKIVFFTDNEAPFYKKKNVTFSKIAEISTIKVK